MYRIMLISDDRSFGISNIRLSKNILGKEVTKKKDFDLTCELRYSVNITAQLHDVKL